jgi:cytochrome c oxidase cbb3-type subunit III
MKARGICKAGLGALCCVSWLVGCGPSGSARGPKGAARDSSFAALSFQRHRAPAELSNSRGQVVYGRYCAICHGDSGDGDGFNAYNVKTAFGVSPTAFTDSTAFSRVPEDSVLAAIRGGGSAAGRSVGMPPWEYTLTPGEILDVAAYVWSLSRAAREKSSPK